MGGGGGGGSFGRQTGASWLNILLKDGLVCNLSLVVSLNKFDILELSESPERVLILLLRLFVETFFEGVCFLNLLANSERKDRSLVSKHHY